MTSSKKIITVFCATGRQGSGAVKYLCEDGTFHVRAVTRNPDSEAAKGLALQGAEIVKADLDDKESVVRALEGAYGVFAVTDFWTAYAREEIQGKTLVDAAKQTGIQHFVFSALEHSEVNIEHFETKARANDYLIALGIPRTSIFTSVFLETFGTSPIWSLTRDKVDGVLTLNPGFPSDVPFPLIAGQDCGVIAGIAFKDPEKYVGKDILAATSKVTPREIAAGLEEIMGEKVKVQETTMEEFEKMKNTMFPAVWGTMKWFYLYPEKRDVKATLEILPKARSMKDCIMKKGGKSIFGQL